MPRKALAILLVCATSILLAMFGWQYYTSGQPTGNHTPCVARVYDQYLYKDDLDTVTQVAETPEEQTRLAEQYIQTWITKQLLTAEAERNSTLDPTAIAKQLSDYKHALLVHSYLERVINDQLDKEVSDQEIETYYQAHKENFVLRSPIFQGKWVIAPKETTRKKKLRRLLLQANDDTQLKALNSYCFQFAKEYSLDASTWLDWENVLRDTPFQRVKNKVHLLTRNKLLYRSDEAYDYYIKIEAYKLPRDIAPLPLVKDQITDIIIYKRKIALANKIKQDIVTKAKRNNHCTIYEY